MEIYRPIADPTPAPLLVNTRTAAKMLAVCERTVASMAARGDLRAVHIGKSVRFAVEDLRQWIARQQKKSENAKDCL